MRRMMVASAVAWLLAVPGAGAQPAPVPREGASHAVPLYGTLLRPYDAPDDPFAPGHRGLDVSAAPGTPVRASAAGTVTFAGVVAGNRSVTIDHGDGLRTTYSFLASLAVRAGQVVDRGTVVGTVGEGHPGSGLPPHVHLSARRAGRYIDPVELYVGSSYSDLVALVE